MRKRSEEKHESTGLISTGLQTQLAFFKSLTESPTLMVMFAIGVVFFGGFVMFLYNMAGA